MYQSNCWGSDSPPKTEMLGVSFFDLPVPHIFGTFCSQAFANISGNETQPLVPNIKPELEDEGFDWENINPKRFGHWEPLMARKNPANLHKLPKLNWSAGFRSSTVPIIDSVIHG